MKDELIIKSDKETIKFATKIASFFDVKDVILLSGDLGAGKTTFVKGVGKYLKVKEEINSPTFNILKCYFSGIIPLYHIDAYRLEDVNPENKNIGLEEVIDGDGICLIEWPLFIKEFIDFSYSLNIEISINKNGDRKFVFYTENKKYRELFKFLKDLK